MHALTMASQESATWTLQNRRVRRELPELTRQLAILLRSGERLDRALDMTGELARNPRLKSAMSALRDQVRAGESFPDALGRHPALFSEFYVSVVAVGDASGQLDASLQRVADHLLRQQRFSDALTTALSYPLLLLGVTGLSLVVLVLYVLPEFRALFDDAGVGLPWFTEALLRLSDGLRAYGWAGALAVLGLASFWRARLRQPDVRYRRDRFLLRVPLVSDLVRRIDTARFSDSLAAALAGGAPLLDGLRMSRASIANRFLRRSLDPAIEAVKEGGRLGEALRRNTSFPALAARMIQVGEESGNLAHSLQYVAEVYDREFDTSVKRLLNVLEPALIILIGSGVAVVILSMVSAIQRLNTFPA